MLREESQVQDLERFYKNRGSMRYACISQRRLQRGNLGAQERGNSAELTDKKGVGHKTESLENDGVCLRVPEKDCPLPPPHPWVVLSALTVLPPILSLLNFYPDNFPPQIFFPILTFFF